MPLLSKSDAVQGAKYLAVGLSTALLELVLFQLLYGFFGWGIPPSNVTAVVVATATNFLLNRNVSFASTSNLLRSLVLYIMLFLFNTAFSTLTIMFFTSLGCPALIIKVATMGCIVCWNYFLYRNIVFR